VADVDTAPAAFFTFDPESQQYSTVGARCTMGIGATRHGEDAAKKRPAESVQ
jgi:hypothetical protein